MYIKISKVVLVSVFALMSVACTFETSENQNGSTSITISSSPNSNPTDVNSSSDGDDNSSSTSTSDNNDSANTNNDNNDSNDSSSTSSTDDNSSSSDSNDSTENGSDSGSDNSYASYKGLQFNYKNLSPSAYKLEQLSDSEFNELNESVRLKVANKLLESLFFGYPYKELKEKINQDNFLSSIRESFEKYEIDSSKLEQKILDKEYYKQYSTYYVPEVMHILTRFYEMNKLDKYYFHNWIAYILTQTIMFSPAYELESVYEANVANVYNRLVGMLGADNGMRYITYIHMTSEDNWRRFRSPEDNGREMLEIYILDTNDSHVPLSAKALQNWKLNRGETLEIGLNKNIEPINLFGTTVYNGEDFYRELVKSDLFTYGATRRLVDFFFPLKTDEKREEITNKIVSSNPEKWEDILLQILFSKEYLLHNNRPLSEEELFFSLSKKIYFQTNQSWFRNMKDNLEKAHQAPMKYKLGRLERVPLDSLSFASYHQFIRKDVLLNKVYPEETDRSSWKYDGWKEDLISLDNFVFIENDHENTLRNYIDYLFLNILSRKPYEKEYNLLRDHFMQKDKSMLRNRFNMLTRRDYDEEKYRKDYRINITMVVLEYLSRLEDIYLQKKEN